MYRVFLYLNTVVYLIQLEDLIKDGGYGTANSDDSHNKNVDDDQISSVIDLTQQDDHITQEPFPERNSSFSPKETKSHHDEFSEKFYGRIGLPKVTDTQVILEKETADKPYTDRERKQLKNTVNTYSPILRHK